MNEGAIPPTEGDEQGDALQFRALAKYSGDHVFMLDRNGMYLFSNEGEAPPGASRRGGLVGRRLHDVTPPDTARLYHEKLEAVFATGKVLSFSHEVTAKQGTTYNQTTLYPIHRDQRIWAVGGISRDVSALREVEKQLFQAQKMESLGTLVAGVAHEINNPINLMLFNLPLLEKLWADLMPALARLPKASQQKKFGGLTLEFIEQNILRLIGDMEMAANRVVRIVKSLKSFSRKNNPAEKSLVQVNTAVENAARLAQATLKKSKTELQLRLAPDLPLLHANLQNLEHVVLNLMINALESIEHDHGWVRIETQWHEPDQMIKIVVADNGRGINPSVADKIFDPFFTDRQAQGGTGLGLSVTYNLVKAHDGKISFDSTEGQGAQFTVSLPVGEKRKPFSVMVVDDDLGFRKLVTQVLTRQTGSTVEGFANGAEALIRLGSDPPDLLILDMFMPEIDGLGVCRAIKKKLGIERMKVIIVTGFPDHPNLGEAARLGFRHIITKPLDLDHFVRLAKNELYGKLP